jgi:predicted molibdopterin-dependent oxidoreductase YjgC
MIRRNGELVPASWDEALDLVEHHFHEASKDLMVLAGGRLANEDLFNLRQLSNARQGRAFLDSYIWGRFGCPGGCWSGY